MRSAVTQEQYQQFMTMSAANNMTGQRIVPMPGNEQLAAMQYNNAAMRGVSVRPAMNNGPAVRSQLNDASTAAAYAALQNAQNASKLNVYVF